MLITAQQYYLTFHRLLLVKLSRIVKYCMVKEVHSMHKINDARLRLYGLLVLNSILLLFIYPDMYLIMGIPFWKIALLSIAYTWFTWEVTRLIILNVRRKYPGVESVRKRLRRLILVLLPVTILISVIKIYATEKTGYYGENAVFTIYSYLYGTGMNIFYSIVITGAYESLYYWEQWKRTYAETEELKKENLQSQLDQLKNQVKPHFLFNSLNSLLALVDEDQTRAKKFIEELSFIYRYLLQCNDKELICLESELNFIRAFYFLLKTRFENGLELEIKVSEAHQQHWQLPPLTLQMLVENAVKHNMVSSNSPLKISIYTDNDQLIVSNNRQKKNLTVQSAKMGLTNIAAKYRLLNHPGILINETDNMFKVTLPLIKNEAA